MWLLLALVALLLTLAQRAASLPRGTPTLTDINRELRAVGLPAIRVYKVGP